MKRVKYKVYHKSLNKFGEELCGDVVKFKEYCGNFVFVLSDGLGSGVKANILATLTAEILTTLLKEGEELEEAIETVTKTLPVHKKVGLAYSTFTLFLGDHSGNVEIVNFENPLPVIIRNSEIFNKKFSIIKIKERKLRVFKASLNPGDSIAVFTDGLIYAGAGAQFNFGWGWENIALYVKRLLNKKFHPKVIIENVLKVVDRLYNHHCRDDSTIALISLKSLSGLVIMTGPPLNPSDDEKVVKKFLEFDGKKVICGGTTANIVSKLTGETPLYDPKTVRPGIPPMGKMKGVDLVTEGVLTLSETLKILKNVKCDETLIPKDRNAATELSQLLLQADYIKVLLGQSISPIYQHPSLPSNLSIRHRLVEELVDLLKKCGKEVSIEYF